MVMRLVPFWSSIKTDRKLEIIFIFTFFFIKTNMDSPNIKVRKSVL